MQRALSKLVDKIKTQLSVLQLYEEPTSDCSPVLYVWFYPNFQDWLNEHAQQYDQRQSGSDQAVGECRAVDMPGREFATIFDLSANRDSPFLSRLPRVI
jgi:hypothetical protein